MNYTIYDSTGVYQGFYQGSAAIPAGNLSPGSVAIEGTYAETTRLVNGVVTDFSLAEVQAATDAMLATQVRSERDGRLSETDYVFIGDSPYSTTTQAAYRVYRQGLRDVPAQTGFPNTIVWPVRPART